jgi:hypothetical protein
VLSVVAGGPVFREEIFAALEEHVREKRCKIYFLELAITDESDILRVINTNLRLAVAHGYDLVELRMPSDILFEGNPEYHHMLEAFVECCDLHDEVDGRVVMLGNCGSDIMMRCITWAAIWRESNYLEESYRELADIPIHVWYTFHDNDVVIQEVKITRKAIAPGTFTYEAWSKDSWQSFLAQERAFKNLINNSGRLVGLPACRLCADGKLCNTSFLVVFLTHELLPRATWRQTSGVLQHEVNFRKRGGLQSYREEALAIAAVTAKGLGKRPPLYKLFRKGNGIPAAPSGNFSYEHAKAHMEADETLGMAPSQSAGRKIRRQAAQTRHSLQTALETGMDAGGLGQPYLPPAPMSAAPTPRPSGSSQQRSRSGSAQRRSRPPPPPRTRADFAPLHRMD